MLVEGYKLKIVQMLPTISYGDAIGNDALAIRDMLIKEGIETHIYAEGIDERLPKSTASYPDEYKDAEDTIILYHLSTGSALNKIVQGYKARLFVIYHNVTPPEFFRPYSAFYSRLCAQGLNQVNEMACSPELCIADSYLNKSDLISMGYKCPIEVVPILINFEDYKKKYNKNIVDKYNADGYVNILFTGRIAPNKKQEDVISAFYYYHKFINPKSRLFIVGSYNWQDIYCKKVKKYIEEIGTDGIYLTGHIPFEEILSYYKLADIFVCLSEHEGFCVPLVEAMFFDIPIIAYDSTAVGETLGGAGILLKDKDPKVVAEAINIVVTDEKLRETMKEKGRKRLKDFDNEAVKKQFMTILKKYI